MQSRTQCVGRAGTGEYKCVPKCSGFLFVKSTAWAGAWSSPAQVVFLSFWAYTHTEQNKVSQRACSYSMGHKGRRAWEAYTCLQARGQEVPKAKAKSPAHINRFACSLLCQKGKGGKVWCMQGRHGGRQGMKAGKGCNMSQPTVHLSCPSFLVSEA